MKVLIGTAIYLSLSAAAVAAAEVTATVHDRDGKRLGAVIIQDLPSGVALATLTLTACPKACMAFTYMKLATVPQRISNPCTPVRFRYSPPIKAMGYEFLYSLGITSGISFTFCARSVRDHLRFAAACRARMI